MKEATAKSAMNSEYFRTAWMTYNCCYYYSYELETAIPLRATPFAAGSHISFSKKVKAMYTGAISTMGVHSALTNTFFF